MLVTLQAISESIQILKILPSQTTQPKLHKFNISSSWSVVSFPVKDPFCISFHQFSILYIYWLQFFFHFLRKLARTARYTCSVWNRYVPSCSYSQIFGIPSQQFCLLCFLFYLLFSQTHFCVLILNTLLDNAYSFLNIHSCAMSLYGKTLYHTVDMPVVAMAVPVHWFCPNDCVPLIFSH